MNVATELPRYGSSRAGYFCILEGCTCGGDPLRWDEHVALTHIGDCEYEDGYLSKMDDRFLNVRYLFRLEAGPYEIPASAMKG